MDGIGTFFWSNSRYYEGEWKNSSINGFGIFYDTGKIFMGKEKYNKNKEIKKIYLTLLKKETL